jgi:hypothetical protein
MAMLKEIMEKAGGGILRDSESNIVVANDLGIATTDSGAELLALNQGFMICKFCKN